jgi:hypothetical protein
MLGFAILSNRGCSNAHLNTWSLTHEQAWENRIYFENGVGKLIQEGKLRI